MNILEAEDMVKGLPDQVLFQIAQNPPPNIPQFLAVSEVQRRQDMRQRYQAKQPEQTVKDQILQSGIAAAGGPPPGAGQPPPMAPPGAAPPGAPMQQPMTGAPMGGMFRGGMTRMANGGLTPGGIVYMQQGRTVPSEEEVRRILAKSPYQRTAEENELLRAAGRTLTQRRLDPDGIVSRAESALASPFIRRATTDGAYRLSDEDLAAAGERTGAVNERIYRALGGRQYVEPTPAAPAAAPAAAPGPVDFMAAQSQPQMNFNMPLTAPVAAPQSAPQEATQVAPPAPNVAPGGIGDLAPRQQTGGIPSYLADLLKPQERSPEVQAAIDLNRQMAEQGLPAPIDLSQYVKSAQQRQQEAQTEARRMAIANTLMGLGTGLVAGDPAAGLQRATQMATETLREGRKEAQAEGRMAEQLQLQQAQQQRQAVLDAMKFKSESVNAIANLVSGEEKANRNDRLQAAQIVATYNAALDRNRAELESQGRLDERSLRTARTAALQSAREIYLANPANVTGKTNDEIARELSEMARMLDPDSFGSSGTTAATPSGKSRFTITEVRTGR